MKLREESSVLKIQSSSQILEWVFACPLLDSEDPLSPPSAHTEGKLPASRRLTWPFSYRAEIKKIEHLRLAVCPPALPGCELQDHLGVEGVRPEAEP